MSARTLLKMDDAPLPTASESVTPLAIRVTLGDGRSHTYVVAQGERSLEIGRGRWTNYRNGHLSVADKHVSKNHCRLFWDDLYGWMLEDLGSVNGTRVNGFFAIGMLEVGRGLDMQLGSTVIGVTALSR
ncbi:MAG: FHA domain-containing protein [Gammaproteobacteria bacterium]